MKKSRRKKRRVIIIHILCFSVFTSLHMAACSQKADSIKIAAIYENALQSQEAYINLQTICKEAAPRELGSEKSIRAVNLFRSFIEKQDCDTVYLQNFKTDAWKQLSSTLSYTAQNGKQINFNVKALGPSTPTNSEGIRAEVIEVSGMDELKSLKKEDVAGKIVFFNNKMDNTIIEPVNAYVDAVQPRLFGANVASEKGAAACIMRSISMLENDFVHTGGMHYDTTSDNIPAVAISTRDAEKLSNILDKDKNVTLNLIVESEIQRNVETSNIIAEIRGNEKPEEVIVIGAHIDTWYNTPGAHDDGAGCMQMIDVLRIIQELGIENRRTIRLVLFMDEEMSKSGVRAYVGQCTNKNETYIAAIESDLGGYEPCGFLIDGSEHEIKQIQKFKSLLLPYDLNRIEKGFGGGDMIVLKQKFGFPSIALKVNSQRYFEILHTEKDTFDKVNPRELQLGTAAITSLVYLLDKYGL